MADSPAGAGRKGWGVLLMLVGGCILGIYVGVAQEPFIAIVALLTFGAGVIAYPSSRSRRKRRSNKPWEE
jgi:hypothetical protein